MNTSTPREIRHARTKEAILEAARKVIAKQGAEAISMRALAKAIDYSPSALYKYFDSKETIIRAIRAEGFERMIAYIVTTVANAGDDLAWRERLVEAGMAYLDFAANNPEHYLLMFNIERESVDPNQILHYFEVSGIAQIVEQEIAAGNLIQPEGYTPLAMVYHAWVTAHGIAMMQLTLLKSLRPEFDALSRHIMQNVIDGFTPR